MIMRKSRLSRNILRSEIVKTINEACGGGCGGSDMEVQLPWGHQPEVQSQEHDSVGMLSKEEALDLVSMIAARTSCPVTQQALEDAVDDLDPETVRDDGEHIMGGMDSDSAFGAGYTMGQGERDEFSYTGDVAQLAPQQAFALGNKAGVMGLQENRRLNKRELRRLISRELSLVK